MKTWAKLIGGAYDPANIDDYRGDFRAERITRNSVTYFNPQTNEVVIAFRGTQATNTLDLLSDYNIAKGGAPIMRYNFGEYELAQAKASHPDAKMIVAGHSLGGNVSHHLGTKYGIESHSYAVGSTPYTWFSMKRGNSKNKIYHAGVFDPLSVSSRLLSGEHIYSAPLRGHALSNFILDTQQEEDGE